ncbi:MAG: SDR family oxidoreductase [Actinobacteria bacterium]|nr:SDR family oxidoreductase [Actinomycetota bacterium]
MGLDLTGRSVLVTGASAGIGAALAEGFAERGATVGICARREDRLRKVLTACQAHSPESRMWGVDLADLDGIETFAHRANAELGGIDVLVNNAGMPKRRKVLALSEGDIDNVMALNYRSPVRLILALLPGMLERSRADGFTRRIVNVSSIAGRLSPPGEAAYSASKAALTAFSEALAGELWQEPVDVHVVFPGVIDTELFELPDNDPHLASDMERLPPAAVVDAVLDQMESGKFESYVPEWLADIVTGKARDAQGFMEGAAAYLREQEEKAARS